MGVLQGWRGQDHVRRRSRRDDQSGWVGKTVVSAALVLLLATVAAWSLDLIGPWYHYLRDDRPASADSPSRVAPPPGLDLPALTSAGPVATPLADPSDSSDPSTDDAGVDQAAVQAALAPYLSDPDLGGHVVAAVANLSPDGPGGADAAPVVTVGEGAATPASTTKLLTTTAALAALGPETTFATRVASGGRGRIVLVGGGDPLLASAPPTGDDSSYPVPADLTTLAAKTATELTDQGRTRVRLGYDDSLFTGPTADPAWPASYGPDGVVAPITALWVDEGRPSSGIGRVGDPSLVAAQTFAAALGARGITVVGSPEHGTASGDGRTLASVSSPPLREIVEHTLLVSDNEAAEVLGHQVGLEVGGTGSFAGGVSGVLSTLAGLGVPTDDVELHDGSGLSRENLVAPAVLVAVLQAAFDPDHPELGAVADGLPVSGFSGSLTNRFDEAFPDARGLVRAKTGTLTGVTSLAGIAVDQQGHAMVFALMADRVAEVDETRAQNALDVAAGALGGCSCGSG